MLRLRPSRIICVFSFAQHSQARWNGPSSVFLVFHVLGTTTLQSSSVSTPTSSCQGDTRVLSMNTCRRWREVKPWRAEQLSLTRNSFLLLGYPSRIASIMSDAWQGQSTKSLRIYCRSTRLHYHLLPLILVVQDWHLKSFLHHTKWARSGADNNCCLLFCHVNWSFNP